MLGLEGGGSGITPAPSTQYLHFTCIRMVIHKLSFSNLSWRTICNSVMYIL